MLDRLRHNTNIGGIRIKDFTVKVSCYADDILCFLDGQPNSVRALFGDLGKFAKFSGLKPNIAKTQAMWIGSNLTKRICDEIPIVWVKEMKLLGIVFCRDLERMPALNYTSKIKEMEKIMCSWRERLLKIVGKIQIIRSLVLSKITHVLTSLPQPSEEVIKSLNAKLHRFIWNGKIDRVKRSVLAKPVALGGLNAIDLCDQVKALKVTWVRKALTSNHAWTALLKDVLPVHKSSIWEKGSASLKKMAVNTKNVFWKEVILAYADVVNSYAIDACDVGKCPIWFSDHTKFKADAINQWFERGVYYISDSTRA